MTELLLTVELAEAMDLLKDALMIKVYDIYWLVCALVVTVYCILLTALKSCTQQYKHTPLRGPKQSRTAWHMQHAR